MVNIIVYQGHHIIGVALAVAVDARCWCGGLRLVALRQQDYKQYGGGSSRHRDRLQPAHAGRLLYAPLPGVGRMDLFYQFVCIHIPFNLRSFSLMRAMRVVTLVGLMPVIRPISSVEKPSR